MRYRCLFCNEVLSTDDLTHESADSVAATHHAVCLQRPIKVGDYVEWDNGVIHVYGDVVSVEYAFAQIHIMVEQEKGTNSFLGHLVTFPVRELRRVPALQPGEMRFDRVAAPSLCNGEHAAPACGDPNCVHLVPGPALGYDGAFDGTHLTIEHHGPRWSSKYGLIGQRVNVREVGGEVSPINRPSADRSPPAPPGPSRIDGLTTEDCLRLFVAETREDPSSVADLNASGYYRLTSAQLVAARALWSERLRAKVAASESERRSREVRVVVTPEVDPWE